MPDGGQDGFYVQRPWQWRLRALRNYVRGHELVVVSGNGGIDFWIGNNPSYDKTVGIRPDIEWQRLVEEPSKAGEHGKAAGSRYFVRKTLRWAVDEPWAFARLQAHKLRLLVSGSEIYGQAAVVCARRHLYAVLACERGPGLHGSLD